jgi:hypothetical protein
MGWYSGWAVNSLFSKSILFKCFKFDSDLNTYAT